MSPEAVLVDSHVTSFRDHPAHSAVTCAAESVQTVLQRHPRLAQSVGSLWLGTARPGASDGRESGLGISVAVETGLPGIPAYDVHAYCASANVAIYRAVRDVESGAADVAVAVGVEHMSRYPRRGALVPEAVPRWADGFSPATFYALCAARYAAEYGVTDRDLAEIAVRNKRLALENPEAKMAATLSAEDVLGSRTVSSPLTLYQCCANADGSGAVLIASAEAVKSLDPDGSGAARVAGMGLATATHPEKSSLVSFEEDVRSSATAYSEAAVGPEEVTVVELHDAFTISQAIHLEDIGLARRGEGAFLGTRQTDPAVNPSGGLLGRGHPLGASGIAQFHSVRTYLERHGGVGLVQQAGGLQLLGQMLSVTAVLTPTSEVML